MPRGGPRPNAGRKKNSPSKASIARQERVSGTGMTPLDVMIEAMRFFRGLAAQEKAKGAEGRMSEIRTNLKLAADIAKDAARYVHPALSAQTIAGDPHKPVTATLNVRFV